MTTHFTKTASGLWIVLALAAASARADITPAIMFGEHMVLQQGIAVPVWGTAAPGEEVTVRFRAQEKKTTAAADGKWLVKLDPLKPGESSALSIAGRNTVTFSDVLVGVIQAAKGGVPSSVFIANHDFHADPEIGKALANWDEQHPYEAEQKKYEAALEKWKSKIPLGRRVHRRA